jgi:hypothetical protein
MNPVESLRSIATRRAALEDEEFEAIRELRACAVTWREIAELGGWGSPQAAEQQYSRLAIRYLERFDRDGSPR